MLDRWTCQSPILVLQAWASSPSHKMHILCGGASSGDLSSLYTVPGILGRLSNSPRPQSRWELSRDSESHPRPLKVSQQKTFLLP